MGIPPNQKRALYYGYEAYIKEIDKVPFNVHSGIVIFTQV